MQWHKIGITKNLSEGYTKCFFKINSLVSIMLTFRKVNFPSSLVIERPKTFTCEFTFLQCSTFLLKNVKFQLTNICLASMGDDKTIKTVCASGWRLLNLSGVYIDEENEKPGTYLKSFPIKCILLGSVLLFKKKKKKKNTPLENIDAWQNDILARALGWALEEPVIPFRNWVRYTYFFS